VGNHLFAVRIDGAPGLDWRRDYGALSYSLVETPSEVSKAVTAHLDAFGLTFGAFDFGIDKGGRYWFYECNPNGQWAWFPEEITAQITALYRPVGPTWEPLHRARTTEGEWLRLVYSDTT